MKSKTKIQYFQDVNLEETQTVPENTLSPLRGLYSKDSDLIYSSGSVHSRIIPGSLNSRVAGSFRSTHSFRSNVTSQSSVKDKPKHSR